MLVISRLLHKSLAEEADVPPFLEDLKNQLASLRRKLLVHIDRRLTSSETARDVLVEAMCAFSLATSSLPKDVLRHFLHVRREALAARLGRNDGDGDVLDGLKVYVRTLQDTQTLFPRRLAESLAKLKAQPLLRDPDVRVLMELNLDLHERWVPDEVRNFTPWVRHEDFQKTEAEKVLKDWARKAFGAFLDGLKGKLEGIEDLTKLVKLRKQLLETWLSTDGHPTGFASSEVLSGLRSAVNSQLNHAIHRRVGRLSLVGSEVRGVIERWQAGLNDVHFSLWDSSMTAIDVSNGASAFKQAILNRSHGRNDALLRVLDKWNTWLRSIDEVEVIIESLKHTKWDVDFDADEEVDELELDSKESLLNDEDPLELQEKFIEALSGAMDALESEIQGCAAKFASDHSLHQSLFFLRLIREIRQYLPKHCQHPRFALSLVPPAYQTLADSILRTALHSFERTMGRTSRARKVPTRALWQGTPALPVQPSVAVFKLLLGIVEAMNEVGSDIWTVDATNVLKRELRAKLVPLFDVTRSAKTTTNSAQHRTNGLTDAQKEEQEPMPASVESVSHSYDEFDLQTLFDTIFLQKATALQSSRTETEADDASTLSLVSWAAKVHSKVPDDIGKEGLDRVTKAAEAYWVRVGLLFGLLS